MRHEHVVQHEHVALAPDVRLGFLLHHLSNYGQGSRIDQASVSILSVKSEPIFAAANAEQLRIGVLVEPARVEALGLVEPDFLSSLRMDCDR